ncbi:hypothetical protein PIROE2DRAFT_13693, partial [Piromyces sp. E2]
MTLFSSQNMTAKFEEYGNTIESFLLKKIKNNGEEDHLILYNTGDAVKTCKLEDKWVGL